ncbi:angiopoietin-related protein 3-like [Tigriopus californicus]|uniref:angiopoietin-related protein 3-like n=1 Tax=Tigriopus californicus TaxID=6832 RepID=UPI0027DA2E91|nr:angiopoietin-related protein 3-like [Tigriopus californicus]
MPPRHSDRTNLFGVMVALSGLQLLFVPAQAVEALAVPSMASLEERVTSLQQVMDSVQGSLITSVRLIQDQLDQFGKNHLNKIESRLAALETSVTSVDANVKHIQERAHVWDTFQHHVTAWADLMRTLDSKVDHLGRSQTEKLTTTTDQLFNMQSNWDAGLAHVKARLQKIESSIAAGHDPSVAFTARGILSTLKRVESKLDAVVRKESRIDSTDEGRPSKTHCRDVSASLADISERLEYLEDHIRESQFREPEYISDYEIGGEMSELSVTSPTLDNQIMRAMRRMTVPLKRIHKRLRTLDTMEHKFEGILAQMDQSIDGATHDIEGKFNDFFNMTMEMFEHQHLQVEKQGLNFASIIQCCRGVHSDLSGLQATLIPVITRMDSLMQSKEETLGRREERLREQMRFDTNRILAVLREHETLLIQDVETAPNASSAPPEPSPSLPPDSSSPNQEVVATPKDSLSGSDSRSLQSGPSIPKSVLKGCEDLMKSRGVIPSSGVYENVYDSFSTSSPSQKPDTWHHRRYCDCETSGGGWTVIQKRDDFGLPRENFTRSWGDYRAGFGDLTREFWLGNEIIHDLTQREPMELLIELRDFEGLVVYAQYHTFRLEDEGENYRLIVGGYEGNATDSLSAHNGFGFSTYDRNNDEAPRCCPCAPAYGGGWWFYSCFEANLNGEYFEDPTANDYFRGIIWELWHGDYSLRSAKMMIRPKSVAYAHSNPRDP